MSGTKRENILNISKNCLGEKYIFEQADDGKFYPIGEGGSGIVYTANQVFSKDEHVYAKRAIKFFAYRDDLIEKWGYVSKDNFDVEIKNITRFNHQNILKVIDGNYYEVSIDDSTSKSIPFTVTEFIEGPNLELLFNDDNKDLCKQILCNEEAVFSLFIQILSGLEYLHKNNFYHCDIAPKNIFVKVNVDNDFLAVIGDLGAGKTVRPKMFEQTRVIGTRNYMPTKVLEVKDKEVSYEAFSKMQPAWDIYSTILTLKEIINKIKSCGWLKFDCWNLDRLNEKIGENSYDSISSILTDVEYLQPSNNQIFKLDELSEASKSIGQVLLPINSVYLSFRMKKLSKHDMLLRLIDVPQLLEGATTFPGANHTRYEHSLGTYEMMRKAMLSLLRNKEYAKFFSERYVIIGLLAALLSSLTNFPYSYAINELQSQEPRLYNKLSTRKLFRKLMQQKSEVSHKSLEECINELFQEYRISTSDIEYVIFGKESSGSRNRELDILHAILNSSVGVRVVDYMMRDSHHIGLTYKIDVEALFQSMYIHQMEFCLRQPGITSAEQIITNRYWLFKRIYWSDPNRANAALLKHIFYTVYNKKFEDSLYKGFATASKHSIQEMILKNVDYQNKVSITNSINLLNQKGQTRYKSILVLDKNSEYPNSNEICNAFSNKTYSEQHLLRDRIEEKFVKKYRISDVKLNYGPIILIDMPYEKKENKLGEDVRILRYDESYLLLTKASGIVAGIRSAFEDQLVLLRVFVRPDVFQEIIDKHDRKDVERFISEKLYDLL